MCLIIVAHWTCAIAFLFIRHLGAVNSFTNETPQPGGKCHDNDDSRFTVSPDITVGELYASAPRVAMLELQISFPPGGMFIAAREGTRGKQLGRGERVPLRQHGYRDAG